MSTKKFLSLEGLTEYDAMIKQEILNSDESTLTSAKNYTDESIDNMELITTSDIDTICGGAIQYAEDVMF